MRDARPVRALADFIRRVGLSSPLTRRSRLRELFRRAAKRNGDLRRCPKQIFSADSERVALRFRVRRGTRKDPLRLRVWRVASGGGE
jgi:hypothetical protein